jgi:serine/threonine-protein kinase
MGEVRLCIDRDLGRKVAVKISQATNQISREMFLREARIQGQLEHPAIVPVYELGKMPDGQPYFAMRRVHGRSLKEALERYTRTKLLGAFVSICLAIDFAHSKNVIHRDLKPDNIMLGEFGEVYILDWGIAKIIGEPDPNLSLPLPRPPDDSFQTTDGGVFGTPGYMAPEQARGDQEAISVGTDVYGLGLILFEILTGEPMHSSSISLRSPELAIPPELVAICERALEFDLDARWPSAREMANAIERFLEGDRDLEARRKAAGGFAIPGRSPILLMPYGTHRDPTVWERPEEMDPERFSPERSVGRARYAYFPFGGGARQCIGNAFAMMEGQIITAMMVRRFRPKLVPGTDVIPSSVSTLKPKGGLPMTLERV